MESKRVAQVTIQSKSHLSKIIPIAAGGAYIAVLIAAICRDYERRCRQRDLEMLDLGMKLGVAIQKGTKDVKDSKDNVDP